MRSSRKQARFWDKLIQSIEEGRVAPILGQDLLTLEVNGRQVLAYAYLAEMLAEYLDVPADDLPPGGELNAVACRFLTETRGQDLEDIYSGLKSIWAEAGELPAPAPLVKLAEIEPLDLFVTTTFDPLLVAALEQVRPGGREATRVLAYSPASATDLENGLKRHGGPTVFHLFGKLSTVPDYAVTDEDFLEFIPALYSETRRPNRLFDELERRQLLILGCGYPDWLARFFIRAAAGDRLSMARGRSVVYVAGEGARQDSRLVEFLEHFGGGIPPFAGGAVEFVDQLHEQWTERHPPGTFAAAPAGEEPAVAGGMEPGAVFLSYASEDLVAATAIRESLAREGIDVWFDKAALEPGDAFEQKIRRNIERCSVFVPILSGHTLTTRRRFFRKEWRHAESVAEMAVSMERFIVPVAVDDTPPDAEALPESFRGLHWARLPEGREDEQFVQKIRQLVREYHKARQGVRT